MIIIRRIVIGLRNLLGKGRVERDLDDELRGYLEASIERRMRDGLNRDKATRAARAEMGSVAAIRDYTRDVGWEFTLEAIWQDVKYAGRTLRKSPAFTSAAVFTLALAIGATTAIFSLLDTVMLKFLPVRNPAELVLVTGGVHYPVFQAFRRHTDIFTDLLATSGVRPLEVEIQSGVRERTSVSLVSGSYFSTLGVQAALGRTFTVNEDRVPGEHPVAIASYGYWQRRFGGDPAILGGVLRISGTPLTIVGVAPAGFFGEDVGRAPDLWVPLTMWGHIVPGQNALQNPGMGWLRIIGRVRSGVPVSGPRPELTATLRRVLTDIFGPNAPQDIRRDIARATVTLTPAASGVSNLRAQLAGPLQVVMAAVVMVLLIACANIANLLLARATARRREMDTRLALGMSRARLIRQLLTESFVLAALGGTIGIAFAWLGREGLLRVISADGSRLPVEVTMDGRLFLFVTVVSSATAILFGLAPAWRSARPGIVTSLVARRDAAGHPPQRLGSFLVVFQVALSVVLLMGAGLFLRTIANLRDVDLGFAPERLLVLDINPQAAGYRSERAVAVSRRLLDRIATVPGVSSVTLSEHGVLTGTDNSTDLMRPEGFIAGPEGFPRTRWDIVGPRYFSTIGASVLGRDIRERDDAASPFVVAINEAMARLFFAGADPIGKRLVWGGSGGQQSFEIIAVTGDVKQSGPRDEPQPRFYLPYWQMPQVRPGWILSTTRFLIRTAADPAALAPHLRQLIQAEDSRLSVARVDVGPQLVSRTLVRERMVMLLLIAFGVLASGLACLGLYGVVAYQVAQRTSEIGLRLALGAQRSTVLRLTLGRGVAWIAAGIALGIPLALGASRIVHSLLFGLGTTDAIALSGAIGVMAAAGLLAAYLPALRATTIDPLTALRQE